MNVGRYLRNNGYEFETGTEHARSSPEGLAPMTPEMLRAYLSGDWDTYIRLLKEQETPTIDAAFSMLKNSPTIKEFLNGNTSPKTA